VKPGGIDKRWGSNVPQTARWQLATRALANNLDSGNSVVAQGGAGAPQRNTDSTKHSGND